MKWNWMSRVVCVLLSACLMLGMVTVGQAAPQYVSVAELRDEVADGWHQTYEAYGRTITIGLDEILVPEVTTVPLLSAEPFGEYQGALPEGFVIEENTSLYFNFVKGDPCGPLISGVDLTYMPTTCYSPYDIDWQAHAEGNPISTKEAYDILVSAVAMMYGTEIASTLAIDHITVDGMAYRYNKKTKQIEEPLLDMANYSVNLLQSFYGLPLLSASIPFKKQIRGERLPFPYGVYAYVKSEQDFGGGFSLMKEGIVKIEDVPLAVFSEIKSTLEGLIADGRVRGIRGMRLGYIQFLDESNGNICWLVPAWECNVEYFDDAQLERLINDIDEDNIEEFIQYGSIYILAQNAKFVDLLDTSPDRMVVPKIMTWSEVR